MYLVNFKVFVTSIRTKYIIRKTYGCFFVPF